MATVVRPVSQAQLTGRAELTRLPEAAINIAGTNPNLAEP